MSYVYISFYFEILLISTKLRFLLAVLVNIQQCQHSIIVNLIPYNAFSPNVTVKTADVHFTAAIFKRKCIKTKVDVTYKVNNVRINATEAV